VPSWSRPRDEECGFQYGKLHDRFDQRIPLRQIAILRTGSHAGLLRDFVQTGIGAVAGKCFLRSFENTLTVPLGIRARPALSRL
jgi:hypothetical protein